MASRTCTLAAASVLPPILHHRAPHPFVADAEEKSYIERIDPYRFRIKRGFVPNMNVECRFYVNDLLSQLMFEELEQHTSAKGVGGFLPAVKQLANVAAMPGIVGARCVADAVS